MTKIRKLALVDPDILKNLIAGNCPNNVLNKQMNNKPKTTKTVNHGKGKSVRKAKMVAGLASTKVRPSRLGKQRAANAGSITVIPPPDIRRANALEEELETVLTRRNTKRKNSEKNRRLYNNRLSELMNQQQWYRNNNNNWRGRQDLQGLPPGVDWLMTVTMMRMELFGMTRHYHNQSGSEPQHCSINCGETGWFSGITIIMKWSWMGVLYRALIL